MPRQSVIPEGLIVLLVHKFTHVSPPPRTATLMSFPSAEAKAPPGALLEWPYPISKPSCCPCFEKHRRARCASPSSLSASPTSSTSPLSNALTLCRPDAANDVCEPGPLGEELSRKGWSHRTDPSRPFPHHG